MGITKAIMSVFSVITFSALLFSATILGAFLYANIYEEEIFASLESSFVKDFAETGELKDVQINLDEIRVACALGFQNTISVAESLGQEVDPEVKKLAKHEKLICAYLKSGRIKSEEDFKELMSRLYFRDSLKGEIEKSLFLPAREYLPLVGIITAVLFVLQIFISSQAGKKSFTFSLIMGGISLVTLIYLTNTVIDEQINSQVSEEILNRIPAIIEVVKKYLKDFILYSYIFGFLVANISTIIGMIIGGRNSVEGDELVKYRKKGYEFHKRIKNKHKKH